MGPEQWKPVDGFEEIAEVSSQGRVRHIDATRRRVAGEFYPQSWRGDYLAVWLIKDGVNYRRPVHLLVAKAFLPPQPPGTTADHEDRDRSHNCDTNLRWATVTEQNRNRGTVKLSWDIAEAIRLRQEPSTVLGPEFGINPATVRKIRRGELYGHEV